ncbi:aryl hydrocarbon receptor repressor [Trichechus manatus latirostris]|uniref:Aryl hydrocarbon receptor repressor n=1 Tax=Trichechus manatus latirostris TaxID=127582 RepID=A0A2Y9G1G2_TRIMA|nr:aryl hydrocarbon receptor repressor [Trichechus manatus latirostris]
MIPPGECLYAGRKRRKPIQKQRPALESEKSNPSKRHRDRLNAELDHLASLLPFPADIISKLDKLSVLRLSVSYLRVKSFFQAVQETGSQLPVAGDPSSGDGHPPGGSEVLEGRLLLESLNGFALVVSAEGMIFYASATIVDYLGFHQTDVMHQNVYDYIHVDDRQDFCRQLHWAMDPPSAALGQPTLPETGDDAVLRRLLQAQDPGAGPPSEFAAFLTRCFVCRVRCLLDSTSGFLTMQFQGKLKFLFGQKKKAPSGTVLPPRLSLFCVAVPVLLPSVAEMRMKTALLRAKPRADAGATTDTKAKATPSLCESELHGKPSNIAGRSNGENGIPVFRAHADADRWARAPARAPCLCLGGNDLVLDPEGAAGDREEEAHGRMLSSSSGARGQREVHLYNCRLEAAGKMRHLGWTTERHSQGRSAKLQPQPCGNGPFSMCAEPRGTCVPYAGVQGTFDASGSAAFRNAPSAHPLDHPPSAHCGRTSRPWRDCDQALVSPLTSCHLPHSGAQRFPTGGYSAEDAKLRSAPVPPRALGNPMMSLDVPIKVENDSGSEDTAEGYPKPRSQVWLGASDLAKRQPVSFPNRMHLKTEPDLPAHLPRCADSRHFTYTPHLGPSVLGPHANCRATARPSPSYPAGCACLERMCGLPGPEPAHCPQQEPGARCPCPLRRDGRAPGAAPVVKSEPLDSLPWAKHSQGGVPGMLPKSALAALMPPKAPECMFLP